MKDRINLKITSGFLLNRYINLKLSNHLKPSKSISRQILFNWLNNNLENKICLDLFAGSGILGIESISRGANKVFFIDKQQKIICDLKQNLAKLEIASQAKVFCSDSIFWLNQFLIKQKKVTKNKTIKFDLVYLDPPFNEQKLYDLSLNSLKSLLHKDSLIYIELASFNKSFKIPFWLEVYKQKLKGNILQFLLKPTIFY